VVAAVTRFTSDGVWGRPGGSFLAKGGSGAGHPVTPPITRFTSNGLWGRVAGTFTGKAQAALVSPAGWFRPWDQPRHRRYDARNEQLPFPAVQPAGGPFPHPVVAPITRFASDGTWTRLAGSFAGKPAQAVATPLAWFLAWDQPKLYPVLIEGLDGADLDPPFVPLDWWRDWEQPKHRRYRQLFDEIAFVNFLSSPLVVGRTMGWVEFLATAKSVAKVQGEILSRPLTALPKPIEFLSTARSSQLLQTDLLVTVVADNVAQIETLGTTLVARSSPVPIEFLGTAFVSRTSPVPIEFLAGVQASSPTPVELLTQTISVAGSSPVPIEFLATARAKSRLPIEELTGVLSVSSVVPFEINATVTRDEMLRIELLGGRTLIRVCIVNEAIAMPTITGGSVG
jgi:hypothetical protein